MNQGQHQTSYCTHQGDHPEILAISCYDDPLKNDTWNIEKPSHRLVISQWEVRNIRYRVLVSCKFLWTLEEANHEFTNWVVDGMWDPKIKSAVRSSGFVTHH